MELESENCTRLLNRIESLGADDSTDSIRLANGRILWALRSGSGIDPFLFSAVHTLARVDDPLIRSSFLHTWASLLIYTGMYAEALETTHQQIQELTQHRLEFALPHTYVNEALALRGLRKFRGALKCLSQAVRDRPADDRVVVASNTARIGIHIAQGDFLRAIDVPQLSDSKALAANVAAELMANRAVALACARQGEQATIVAREAQAVTTASEPHVISSLAMAIAARASHGSGAGSDTLIEEALRNVQDTGNVDAFVTAYRGFPPLLQEATSREFPRSDLATIVTRANDVTLARNVISNFDRATYPQQDPLSKREKEVLKLVAQGLRNSDIAQELFISDVTVKAHMRNIMRKLGARSRAHAVSLAEFSD
jgi:DNA-binding NarL/FixJ family response regulator